MSSIYPSLEDLVAGDMADAQVAAAQAAAAAPAVSIAAPGMPVVAVPVAANPYADLQLELSEFTSYMGGLDLRPAAVAHTAGQELAVAMQSTRALVTGAESLGYRRAEVKDGVRKVVMCKDGGGKVGMAVKSIDKGVFVAFVWSGSPAALAGVRFGDQILQINGANVAGWSSGKALKTLKKAAPARVEVVLRDRPFERTVTCVKDSHGHVGFAVKKGSIVGIVQDSSAARNGLLVNHTLCEVNGQNVIGLKDPEIIGVIRAQPRSVTVTVMPDFIFKHIVKRIHFGRINANMDHSIPQV